MHLPKAWVTGMLVEGHHWNSGWSAATHVKQAGQDDDTSWRQLLSETLGYGNRDKHGGIPQGRGDRVWGLNYQKPRREVPSRSAGQIPRSQNQNKSRYLLTLKIATRYAAVLSSRPGLFQGEQGQAGSHHTQASLSVQDRPRCGRR